MTFAVLTLAVSTVITPPVPTDAADGESSMNVVLSLKPDGNRFRLTFAIEATPSNNVDIAFGADGNADGDLSTDETEFLVGWRGNRWVAFDATGEQIAENPSLGGRTELCWMVCLRDDSPVPWSSAATLDGSAAFTEWALSPPPCLFNPDWTLAKVFVRGKGSPDDRLSFGRFNRGLVIIMR